MLRKPRITCCRIWLDFGLRLLQCLLGFCKLFCGFMLLLRTLSLEKNISWKPKTWSLAPRLNFYCTPVLKLFEWALPKKRGLSLFFSISIILHSLNWDFFFETETEQIQLKLRANIDKMFCFMFFGSHLILVRNCPTFLTENFFCILCLTYNRTKYVGPRMKQFFAFGFQISAK